jgi:molybdopterin synthase catalytic subunit
MAYFRYFCRIEAASMDQHHLKEKTPVNIFVRGPVAAGFIGDSIQRHSSKTNIGAHSIFLGQVRADVIEGKKVAAIEYTARETLALKMMHEIRESAFATWPLTCLHVYHSLGAVAAGEISLFVFASSPHRQAAAEACREIVERIKAELPVWGQEIFEDNTRQWKENKV